MARQRVVRRRSVPGSRAGRATAVGPLAGVVGCLGVVFGDIGTSTLYAMDAVTRGQGQLSRDLVLGATSTLIWLLVIIVGVLYARLLLREDNHGEGGLLALLALLRGEVRSARVMAGLTILAIGGAAAFLGDSVITPAISVLSAVEGLELVQPALASYVVPVALSVLVALFVLQPRGSGSIGRIFGPVMLLWFAALAGFGAVAVARDPSVLAALSPSWAVGYFAGQPMMAFLSLGAIVLAVTGAEALYADLGHFGRAAIVRAWTFVVLPALVLAYLGQAAALLAAPAGSNAFFSIVPSWATVPMVLLSTAATIIASQAVISGAFTVVHQAARAGLLPAVRLSERSLHDTGRPYLPAVNWCLAVAVVAIVVGFGSSASLASAYGLAVTGTICVTSTLLVVHLSVRRRRMARLAAGAALLVALVLLAANLPKALTGGWLPLALAAVLAMSMTTWSAGRRRLRSAMRVHEADPAWLHQRLNDAQSPTFRTPGTAVYLTEEPGTVPMALVTQLVTEESLQQRVILLGWTPVDLPTVGRRPHPRVDVEHEIDQVYSVVADVGYDDVVRPSSMLADAQQACGGLLDWLEPDSLTYVVSEPVLRLCREASMPRWRQRLFMLMNRMTGHPSDVLELPDATTIVVGRRVHL